MSAENHAYELQYHSGNPKMCRIKGLKLRALPECEGGGWYTDEASAKVICDALNAIDRATAQPASADVRDSDEAICDLANQIVRYAQNKHAVEANLAAQRMIRKFRDAVVREALETARKIIDCYFAPWGAAKAAQWEVLTGDGKFDAETALKAISSLLPKDTA